MANVILFGAGASAFAKGVHPEEPPLGAGLFQKLADFNRQFIESNTDQTLRDLFNNDFEKGMEEFARKNNPIINSAFQLVMSEFFLQFSISDYNENFYAKLVLVLKNNDVLVDLGTLNYDLLLEDALNKYGPLLKASGSLSLFKLHGSPTYIPMLPPGFETNIPMGCNYIAESETRIGSRAEAEDFCKSAKWMSPAISAFAIGKKSLINESFIRSLQDEFTRIIQNASSVIIVGVRPNDDDHHIWGPLANSSAKIGVVNRDFNAYHEWALKNNRTGAVEHLFSEASEMVHDTKNICKLLSFLK